MLILSNRSNKIKELNGRNVSVLLNDVLIDICDVCVHVCMCYIRFRSIGPVMSDVLMLLTSTTRLKEKVFLIWSSFLLLTLNFICWSLLYYAWWHIICLRNIARTYTCFAIIRSKNVQLCCTIWDAIWT